MSTELEHEGWKGNGTYKSARATWNVALWVDNDQGTYESRLAADTSTPEACEEFARQMFGLHTPDDACLNDVNWTEICEHWSEE